jgi:peptidoglycan/LPS O-acetylase OafA/YrhL
MSALASRDHPRGVHRAIGVWARAAAAAPLVAADTGSRVNNFDALRLLAAVAVVVSHSFAFVGLEQPYVGGSDLGTVGVWVFFGISGFLIAQSWALEPHLGRFLAKRALRILPALLVVLLLTTLLLGVTFTDLPAGVYLTSPETWLYLVRNSVLLTTHELPGVFLDNPYPRDVNGPLWTLAPEVWAYLGLAAVGLVGALRHRWAFPLIAALLVVWPREPTKLLPWPDEVFLLQAFAIGSSLYVLRRHIPWHGGLAALAAAAFVLAAPFDGLSLLLAVTAIPYVAIYTAYRGPAVLRRLTAHGDYSYGIYIYGWPVGQAIVALWPGIGVTALVAIGVPVTYLLAALSWHAVERPALAFKKRLGRPRQG